MRENANTFMFLKNNSACQQQKRKTAVTPLLKHWSYCSLALSNWQIHKSHNAPVPYPTMHHFVTEMCIFLLQNGALWDIHVMHCRIYEMGLLVNPTTWHSQQHLLWFVIFKLYMKAVLDADLHLDAVIHVGVLWQCVHDDVLLFH